MRGLSNPPVPAKPPEPPKPEVVIEKVIVERPVVVMEPFSFRGWWGRFKERRKHKKFQKDMAAGKLPHGRTGNGPVREIAMGGELSLKHIKGGSKT